MTTWDYEKTLKLNFEEVRNANMSRLKRWHSDINEWSGADWSNAMCGEAGETANVVKKLRRIETGVKQAEQGALNDEDARAYLLQKLRKEIGDTYIYLDLLASYYGIRIEDCITLAFNQVSERESFPERI